MKNKLFKCLCLLLIVIAMTVEVFAAGSVSTGISASDTSVNSGDTITVTVNASVDSCGSGGIKLSYDSKVFNLVSGKWLLSSAFMTDFSTGSNDGVFAFVNNSKISGNVFQFELKVKDNAPLGKSNVSATFKADDKSSSSSVGITVACSHSYSNSCDTTCNSCGATRNISHSWNSGTYSQKPTCTAGGTKVYTCKVCGATKSENVSKSSHSYDNNCDPSCNVCGSTRSITHTYQWSLEGDGHIQKCTVCGVSQDQGLHSLEATVSGDSTGHGYKCSVCGLIPNPQPHSFDSDCDTSCDSCSYTRTITHAYSDRAVYDATHHWHECMICGEATEKAAHTPGDAATETTDQLCVDCGYVLQKSPNHQHTMAVDWLSNDVGHWYYCACLAFSPPEAHEFAEGVMNEEDNTISYQCNICGQVVTEAIVEQTLPEETTEPTQEPQNGSDAEISLYGIPLWMILAACLGISVVANIILIICVSVKKRKHHWE